MVKAVNLIVIAVVFSTTLSAQITEKAADSLILARMKREAETSEYVIFRKHLLSDSSLISTASGEKIELDFPCWLFYVRFVNQENETLWGRYLAVNANNANILSININVKEDQGPIDLVTKR